MKTDVEELLTEQMREQAEAVAWRPELLDGALRRHKSRQARRRVVFPALVVGLAGAIAASVALAPADRSAPAVRPKAQTVAYVVRRTRSAVAAAGGDVLRVRSLVSDGWSMTAWFYGGDLGQVRIDSVSPSGVTQDFFYDPVRTVIVDYRTRTWWTESNVPTKAELQHLRSYLRSHPQPRTAEPGEVRLVPGEVIAAEAAFGGPGALLPTPATIRNELTDGSLRLEKTVTEDGRRLLLLRGNDEKLLPVPLKPLSGDHTVELWVSAASYLPVRSVVGQGPHAPPLESEFSWLPATTANVAVFTPIMPAGFRHQAPQCPCG
jgi:hypothetical protein